MDKCKEFAFVIDAEGKQLSPTPVGKAWYLIRKKRAIMIEKYPMVIQLSKAVAHEDIDKSEITLGIDDGSKYVGIGLVQHTKTGKSKPLLKGTLKHRNDVKKKMDIRRTERKYRRYHKEYRPQRYNNRSSSSRPGRLAPTIKQKRQAVLRVVTQLAKWTRIDSIALEDVLIDIRVLTEGKNMYGDQYTKTNKLNPNLRTAVLLRDKFTCQMTGAIEVPLEVHHITPRRFGGADTLSNLITLSRDFHLTIGTNEMEYADHLYEITKGGNVNFKDPQHVMQGKDYLRNELAKTAPVVLTTGAETYAKRADYNIPKSHSNDALAIAGVQHNFVNLRDWTVRPLRSKTKNVTTSKNDILHRDIVQFSSSRSTTSFTGWVTAISSDGKSCSVSGTDGKVYRKYSLNSMRLIWRFSRIQWI